MLLAACDDDPRRGGGIASAAPQAKRVPVALPQGPEVPVLPAPAHPPSEGAPTGPLVFERAQKALEQRDYGEFVACIRVETRRRWLADLVVATALDSADDETDLDPRTQGIRAQARTILTRFGATAAIHKADDASTAKLGALLLDKVQDPDGLLVALLVFGDAHGADLDPVEALRRAGASPDRTPIGSRSTPPSPAAAPLIRLASRIRAPHRIGDITLEGSGGVALTLPPDAGPPSDAFLPIRFWSDGTTTWLDES